MQRSAVISLVLGFYLIGQAAYAKPTTAPTSQPAREVFAWSATATAPSSQPATQAAARDTGKKVHAAASEPEPANIKVAYLDLSHSVVEKPADFSLFGDDRSMTLRALIERLRMARQDKEVRAVLLTLSNADVNLAQAQEIRDALIELRRAGKHTFVYADGYDTTAYTIASAATNVCLLPGGEIMLPGVSIETTFLKGLFDKVGVKADYVQIGEYKGADEQFTRTGPSDELKGELNKLMDSMYGQIVDGISLNRNLSREAVRGIIDESILTADAAKDRGLVDHLVDIDGVRDLMTQELGGPVDLIKDYGAPKREEVDLSSPFAFFALMMHKPHVATKPVVAVVFADGVIVDGEGGGGLLGGSSIGSDAFRRAMRLVSRDDNVMAVVLRINSPGGSALASEAMWQAARRVSAKKPLIISIGSMAASGGYYIASAGDYIIADSSAIVGSIGVVGGKFVTRDLYDKLGVTTEAFRRGRNADLFSSETEFSDRQRRMVTNWMRQTYDQFTARVMTTRAGKIKDIDKVARGRIFIASEARDLGMVDEIGGVDQAIAYAANEAELKPDQYEVRTVPAPRTLADLFNGTEEETRMPFQPKIQISGDSLLGLLSPSVRATLGQGLQMLQLLQDRPVILATPFVIDVR